MRIVQSFYCQKNDLDYSSNFISPEFNWMSWTLSCLQFTKIYGGVDLYVNKNGKEILIDRLGLPYRNVYEVLDECDNYPISFWALPKIMTYSLQNAPFLHVDGDVFIWEKFSEDIIKGDLIAQNIEVDTGSYRKNNNQIKSHNFWLPEVILDYERENKSIFGYNAGILGGNDLSFFQKYTSLALEMVEKNKEKPLLLNDRLGFNVIFEQYLFYCMVKQEGKNVETYFDRAIEDGQYLNMANFRDVPKNKFIHMLGDYKKSKTACLMLAKRLRKDYPEYYYKIIEECKKDQVELKLRYYADDLKPLNETAPFYRTNSLLVGNKETNDDASKKSSVDIEKEISEINDVKKRAWTTDLFNYEKGLLNIEPYYKDEYSYEYDKKQFDFFEKCFHNEMELNRTRFVKNTKAIYFDVKQNWVTEWKKIQKTYETDGEFKMAIVYEPITCFREEVFLDDLDVIIHDLLSSPISLTELKNKVSIYFDSQELEKDAEPFHKLICGRIKEGVENQLIQFFN